MSHEGQVAVITGAASGIGRAAAEIFTERGGSVVAVDINKDALDWTRNKPRIRSVVGDVSDEDLNRAAVEEAVREFGRLDVSVLNAGFPGGGALDEAPIEGFDRLELRDPFGNRVELIMRAKADG